MNKYKVGDEVYYLSENKIGKGVVEKYYADNTSISYDVGHYLYSFDEKDVFYTIDELTDKLKTEYYKSIKQ